MTMYLIAMRAALAKLGTAAFGPLAQRAYELRKKLTPEELERVTAALRKERHP